MMSREQSVHRSKRSRVMLDSGNGEFNQNATPLIVLEDDSVDDENIPVTDNEPRRRRRRKESMATCNPAIKLAPIFLPRKDRVTRKAAPIHVPVKKSKTATTSKAATTNKAATTSKAAITSEATKSFLYSGVPEVIVKTQQLMTQNRVTNEIFDTLEMFPVITHVRGTNSFLDTRIPLLSARSLLPAMLTSTCEQVLLVECTRKFPECTFNNWHKCQLEPSQDGLFCCGINPHKMSRKFIKIFAKKAEMRDVEVEPLPWVVKYQLSRPRLLLISKETKTVFEDWLKVWHYDIQQDGGSSRKLIIKQTKKNLDDEFINDDSEDDAQKHKSIVLKGPTGSGKSSMVNVLAKRHGFRVLEINFSSRRSGIEVLRRVEEATLSRRLTTSSVVDDNHCLLLFRDVDQVYVEEDEGFYSALAQLITASLRPIVMTVTTTDTVPYAFIDPKIEKKEPLFIEIESPSPEDIVSEVLLPLIISEIKNEDSKYDLNEKKMKKDLNYVKTVLDSIARHCNGDIRRSINQTQLLWHSTDFSVPGLHAMLSPKFDESFVMNSSITDSATNEDMTRTSKELAEIARKFKFVTDLDLLVKSSVSDPESDTVPHSFNTYLEFNFHSMLEFDGRHQTKTKKNQFFNLFRRLTLTTSSEKIRQKRMSDNYQNILQNHVEHNGPNDCYEKIGYFRTILKTSIVNSLNEQKRRNGRLRTYFPKVDRENIESFCDNFDFEKNKNGSAMRSDLFFPTIR